MKIIYPVEIDLLSADWTFDFVDPPVLQALQMEDMLALQDAPVIYTELAHDTYIIHIPLLDLLSTDPRNIIDFLQQSKRILQLRTRGIQAEDDLEISSNEVDGGLRRIIISHDEDRCVDHQDSPQLDDQKHVLQDFLIEILFS